MNYLFHTAKTAQKTLASLAILALLAGLLPVAAYTAFAEEVLDADTTEIINVNDEVIEESGDGSAENGSGSETEEEVQNVRDENLALATFSTSILSDTDPVKNETTGVTYATIQSAVDSASNGDVIVVSDGTYTENVSIDKNITLKSEGGAVNTIIDPASGRAISLLGNVANLADITIDGFTLVGNPGEITVQANSQANDGYDYSNITYRNLVINANGGVGLGLFDVNGMTISDVSISGATLGIEAIGVANLTMTNSSVTGSTNTGVNVWTTAGYEANSNLTFTNNTFTNNTTGLKFADTNGVVVTGGTITGGGVGVMSQGSRTTVDGVAFSGMQMSTHQGYGVVGFGGVVGAQDPFGSSAGTYAANVLDVTNSTFSNIARTGALYSGSSSTGTYSGNVHTGKGDGVNMDYGVVLWFGANVEITDSNIKDNSGYVNQWASAAVSANHTSKATLSNNNLTNNVIGVALSDTSEVTMASNNVTGNGWGLVAYGTNVVNAANNWWGHKSGPSSNVTPVGGTGDSIYSYTSPMTFSPWLCAPAPSTLTTTNGVCDDTAPIVEITSPANGASVRGAINVTGTVTDDQALSHYTLYLYPGTTNLSGGGVPAGQINVPGWGNTNTSADHVDVVRTLDTAVLAEGEYQIRLAARDAAGNRDNTDVYNGGTTSVHVVKFTVDRTAPVISNVSVSPRINDNIGGIVTVEFDMTDASGINLDRAKTHVSFVDGPNDSNRAKESAKAEVIHIGGDRYRAVINTRDFVKDNWTGNYNLSISREDTIGNRSSVKPVEFRNILIDNSGPTSVLQTPTNSSSVSGVQRFSFEVSDHTGVKSGYVKLNGPTTKQVDLIQDGTSNVWYADIDTTAFGAGDYTIDARFVDMFDRPRYGSNKGTVTVGNGGSGVTDPEEDITPPAVPSGLVWTDSNGNNVPHLGQTELYAGSASWNANVESDFSHYIYKYWNDIENSEYNDEASAWKTSAQTAIGLPGVFNQGFGTHHFCVVAVDTSGNESACSDVFTITYIEGGSNTSEPGEGTEPTEPETPVNPEEEMVTLEIKITGDGFGNISDNLERLSCALNNESEMWCIGTYVVDTVVTLTATPDAGSTFENSWGTPGFGTCTGNQSPCEVTMTTNITSEAHFDLVSGSNNPTPVTATGGGGYTPGNRSAATPEGEVLGESISRPEPLVLGEQTTIVPFGAPNTGAGGTANMLTIMMLGQLVALPRREIVK